MSYADTADHLADSSLPALVVQSHSSHTEKE